MTFPNTIINHRSQRIENAGYHSDTVRFNSLIFPQGRSVRVGAGGAGTNRPGTEDGNVEQSSRPFRVVGNARSRLEEGRIVMSLEQESMINPL